MRTGLEKTRVRDRAATRFVQMSSAAAIVIVVSALSFLSPKSALALDLGREIGSCFSGGCDVLWKANQRFDEGVRSKTQAMAEGVRVEFEKAMDDLFVTHIQPAIKDIDVIFGKRLAGVDAIVDDALKRIDGIVERAAKIANDFPLNVRDHIIREAGKEAAEFRMALVADVYRVIKKSKCAFDTSVEDAFNRIDDILPKIPTKDFWAWASGNSCYRKDGRFAGVPERKEWVDVYRVKSCLLMREIENADTSVATILDTYIKLQALAQKTACALDVPSAEDRYGREYLTWGEKYAFWSKISTP